MLEISREQLVFCYFVHLTREWHGLTIAPWDATYYAVFPALWNPRKQIFSGGTHNLTELWGFEVWKLVRNLGIPIKSLLLGKSRGIFYTISFEKLAKDYIQQSKCYKVQIARVNCFEVSFEFCMAYKLLFGLLLVL